MIDSRTIGVTKYQALCTLWAAFGSFNFGWNIGSVNIPGDVLKDCVTGHTFHGPFPSCIGVSSDSVWGVIVGCYALGALLGAIVSNPVIDRRGYKFTLVSAAICNIIGALLLSLTTSVAQFIVGRIFVGIAAGAANNALATYISDITTPRGRNVMGGCLQLACAAGIMLDNACALGLAAPPRWRILFAITGIVSLAGFSFLPFVSESPKWLISQRRFDEARNVLAGFRKGADIEAEFSDMLAADMESKERTDDVDVWQVLRGHTPDNLRHQLMCVSALMFFQQLSGINAAIFFSTQIINRSTKDDPADIPTLAQILSFVISFASMLGTLVCMALSAYFGRRVLLIFSHVTMAVFSVVLVIGLVKDITALVVTMIFLFTSFFSIGVGPLPWATAGEITPRYAMTAVSAVGNAIGYVFTFVIGVIFPPMQAAFGNYTFLFFMAWNIVAAIFVFLFVPETKDRRLEDTVKAHSRGIHIVVSSGNRR